ncbi:MAG: hypothetical protein M1835_004518 [Candelina submexicana]|nr:MAG: hypothetical protein M1835_004518 [Candelina submexicana]
MPFHFPLPTTSHVSFVNHLRSDTHPSLLLTATTYRGVLRDGLKRHKRLHPSSQASNLSSVLSSLTDYLPYLFALDAGLNARCTSSGDAVVISQRELVVVWRPILTASIPGQEAARVKGRSLEFEVAYVLSTLAYTYTLLARTQLRILFGQVPLTADQRITAITSATKSLLSACSIHNYLLSRSEQSSAALPIAECTSSVFGALASLALAEATLLAVLKDDPYPAAVARERNKNDTEWMIKSPEIPKVRAHLFARLCVAAADHAGRAYSLLVNLSSMDRTLVRYLDDLRRTARAKACRFLAIDADLSGKTGDAIAWLRGGKKELGASTLDSHESNKSRGFAKFKKDWTEKREDKRIEKDGEWGMDAGRMEEGRVIDMLEKKWIKQNDTVNYQIIPPTEPLLATMPSGREIHSPKSFVVPSLDAEVLSRMTAPPSPSEAVFSGGVSDSGEDKAPGYDKEPVGAYPGAQAELHASGTTYY